MTLDQLAVSKSAHIVGFNAFDSAALKFYGNLGLKHGALLKIIRSAPGRGPIQVKVLNTLYAVRRSDATGIEVAPL